MIVLITIIGIFGFTLQLYRGEDYASYQMLSPEFKEIEQ